MPRLSLLPLGLAGLTTALFACSGHPADGGLRALAHYEARVDITDEPDINTRDPQRTLLFQFFGSHIDSPARCASLAKATARFAGMPIYLDSPGGWLIDRLPTNNAPGETINQDHCEMPVIRLPFNEPMGEPQNGTLEIEGEGQRFEVVIAHAFGDPQVTLVSAAPDRLVVRLQNFMALPAFGDLSVHFFASGEPNRYQVQKTDLTRDGLLELALISNTPASATFDGDLLIDVDLGHQSIVCRGFSGCAMSTRLVRDLEVHFP
jgi:hypothetical protein